MTELVQPDWNRCPGPAVCFALCHAQESSKDALVVAYGQTIDRLLGGKPVTVELGPPEPQPVAAPCPDVTDHVRSLLAQDDIFRKPPRAAAPRLTERLIAAGWTPPKENE